MLGTSKIGRAPAANAPAAAAGVTVFTGASLLVGDGTVIENAAFTSDPTTFRPSRRHGGRDGAGRCDDRRSRGSR